MKPLSIALPIVLAAAAVSSDIHYAGLERR